MTAHRALPKPRRARRRGWWRTMSSVRVRALLSLGLLASTAVIGSYAYWSDSSTLTTGSFAGGSLDLELTTPGQTAGGSGLSANVTDTSIAATTHVMAPGDVRIFPVQVLNAGTVKMTYTATVALASGTLPITTQFDTGCTVAYASAFPYVDTCTGGTALTAAVTPSSTAQSIVSTARAAAAGGSDQLYLIVTLPSGTANSYQSATAALTIAFSGTQATS